MQIYTGDDGKTMGQKEQKKMGLGTMLSPGSSIGRNHHFDVPIAIDNGAYSYYLKGCGFDEYAFLNLL